MNLDEIAAERRWTDKGLRWHGYTPMYEWLTADLRDEPIVLLEIGVFSGDSLRMWAEWFRHPDTRIVGVDVDEVGVRRRGGLQYDDRRIEVYIADQSDAHAMWSIVATVGRPHVVIDDGGHRSREQLATLSLLWDVLQPGGIYAIEDLAVESASETVDHGAQLLSDLLRRGSSLSGLRSIVAMHELLVLRK